MDPLEPKPPRPVPPAPPRPEWLKPAASAPAVPGVTPMMDFFQRRVETLEKELALERDRAQAAQGLLGHQEALKNEVDAHLKALTDQLKREKLERDGDEARSHSRGRVEALEKRLDEMNATFAQLLKEAVTARDGGSSSAALAAELAAFRGALKEGMDGAAQSLLVQQAALKSELDARLAALTDQLKRARTERDGDEARPQSRARVEALEKRLDETNASFARLLKEAVAARDGGPSSAALAAELSAFRGALKDGMDGVARWRGELRELSALVPQVQSLNERLPQDEKHFEESVGRRLDDFSARLARSLEDWKRSQETERAELDARVESLARERGDLGRVWETQARAQREEQFKDRVAREAELSRQIAELASRLSQLAAAQQGSSAGSDSVRQGLERVISILTATPKAKDSVIAELEDEKRSLAELARDRQEALRRFAEERRAVEKSMGDGLLSLTGQLEDERARTRAAEARASESVAPLEVMRMRLGDLERSVADRDARAQQLAAERDELARALMAEADKVRRGYEERRDADAAADARLSELQKRLDEEAGRRASAEGAAADARAQMGALAEQTARSLQERDSTLARFSDWEKERQRLLDVVRKKDEMISLLSSTFQGALKKGS